MLKSVLYVSHSLIEKVDAEDVVGQIVATSVANNLVQGLTGALLFTGTHFAQVLEGDSYHVDEILEKIGRDSRHQEMVVASRMKIATRQFENWSMAYFGPSPFVSRHVTRLLNATTQADQRRAAEWLTELMHEFSLA